MLKDLSYIAHDSEAWLPLLSNRQNSGRYTSLMPHMSPFRSCSFYTFSSASHQRQILDYKYAVHSTSIHHTICWVPYSRVFPILFDRKDSGHIGKLNIILAFKKSPEEVKISLLDITALLRYPENTVHIHPIQNELTAVRKLEFPGFTYSPIRITSWQADCSKVLPH